MKVESTAEEMERSKRPGRRRHGAWRKRVKDGWRNGAGFSWPKDKRVRFSSWQIAVESFSLRSNDRINVAWSSSQNARVLSKVFESFELLFKSRSWNSSDWFNELLRLVLPCDSQEKQKRKLGKLLFCTIYITWWATRRRYWIERIFLLRID